MDMDLLCDLRVTCCVCIGLSPASLLFSSVHPLRRLPQKVENLSTSEREAKMAAATTKKDTHNKGADTLARRWPRQGTAFQRYR